MRLVFAGTPPFAAAALSALLAGGHEIVLVLTRPDAPAGRGMKRSSSQVKQLAEAQRLPLLQPATLRDATVVEQLSRCGAQAMVVAAYGLILPRTVLELFPLGCINIHASLLPRWRGAAPIQHALLAGDQETGISIMRMDEGLDTGPVYMTESLPIEAGETGGSLHDKLAALGARSIVRALDGIASGQMRAQPQPANGATYAHKITREQARIDWSRPAVESERAIRAFNPVPGAFSRYNGQIVKIWAAQLRETPIAETPAGQPGEVMAVCDQGIIVACGDGVLCLTELQRQGGKRLPAAQFVRGFAVAPGERFTD